VQRGQLVILSGGEPDRLFSCALVCDAKPSVFECQKVKSAYSYRATSKHHFQRAECNSFTCPLAEGQVPRADVLDQGGALSVGEKNIQPHSDALTTASGSGPSRCANCSLWRKIRTERTDRFTIAKFARVATESSRLSATTRLRTVHAVVSVGEQGDKIPRARAQRTSTAKQH
jgi:hypothetical protein